MALGAFIGEIDSGDVEGILCASQLTNGRSREMKGSGRVPGKTIDLFTLFVIDRGNFLLRGARPLIDGAEQEDAR